jgi:uncharacterized membrane protein
MLLLIAGACGIVLAASAGLRAFMPLFGLGLASRVLGFSIAPSMEWMASNAGLVGLGVAMVVELVADKVPVVDHALDVVHTIAGPLAGALVTFGLWSDWPPAVAGILAITLGAPVAGVVHAISAATRVKSTIFSGGAFNPAVSLAEDGISAGAILIALVLPILALVMAVFVVLLILRFAFSRRLRNPSPPNSEF